MIEQRCPRLTLPRCLRLAILALVCLFPFRAAFGACMEPIPTVACEYLNSDAVFVGTVISAKTGEQPDDDEPGWFYELTVQQWFRGPQTKTIQVFTENSSGRFRLEPGKRYLLFAYDYHGALDIDCCGNSSLLSVAGHSLRALRELRKTHISDDAVVEGNIFFLGAPDGSRRLGGVRIAVRSSTATVYAISERDGWFSIHVPPGTYSADVEQMSNLKILPFGLTVDPSSFEAIAGRCVGLRFVERSEQ
jgi:hypothetical protein